MPRLDYSWELWQRYPRRWQLYGSSSSYFSQSQSPSHIKSLGIHSPSAHANGCGPQQSAEEDSKLLIFTPGCSSGRSMVRIPLTRLLAISCSRGEGVGVYSQNWRELSVVLTICTWLVFKVTTVSEAITDPIIGDALTIVTLKLIAFTSFWKIYALRVV